MISFEWIFKLHSDEDDEIVVRFLQKLRKAEIIQDIWNFLPLTWISIITAPIKSEAFLDLRIFSNDMTPVHFCKRPWLHRLAYLISIPHMLLFLALEEFFANFSIQIFLLHAK